MIRNIKKKKKLLGETEEAEEKQDLTSVNCKNSGQRLQQESFQKKAEYTDYSHDGSSLINIYPHPDVPQDDSIKRLWWSLPMDVSILLSRQ